MESLYHKDLFMPPGLVLPAGILQLRYTQHARDEAELDELCRLTPYLTDELDTAEAEAIEVGVKERSLTKVLYRRPVTERFDMALVVRPEGRTWSVVTVWANRRSDRHQKLDYHKYSAEDPGGYVHNSEALRELRSRCRHPIQTKQLARDEQERSRIETWLFEPAHTGTGWDDDRARLARFMGGDRIRANRVIQSFANAQL